MNNTKNDKKWIIIQAEIEHAVFTYIDENKKGDISPVKIIKYVSKETGINEHDVTSYFVNKGIVEIFERTRNTLMGLKNNEEYQKVCKEIEKRENKD